MKQESDRLSAAGERGVVSQLISMLSTRIELAAIDTEAHVRATWAAMLSTFIAVVLALIAFAFIGVLVIVVFWDTHRVTAAAGVLAAHAFIAGAIALHSRLAWKSRPAAFAATLRELDLDRAAFRNGP
jgi:uncharacterized membrane protein YqjE